MGELHEDQRRLLRRELSPEAGDRFSRQRRFAPLGAAGQERLQAARVAVVGVGALGSHSAESLARAGVGMLVLVDRDLVDVSNLQRQSLYDEDDARHQRPKATAAAERLTAIRSSGARFEPWIEDFGPSNAERLPDVDLVVDGTDNFDARMVINDLARRRGIPWVYGAALGATGRAMVIAADGTTPCLRCLFPEPPAPESIGTCETDGILEPAIAQVAAFQVAQTLRLLGARARRSRGEAFARGMFCCDVWEGRYEVRLRDARPDPECATCGATPTYPALAESARTPGAVTLCGRDAVQIQPRSAFPVEVDFLALARRLEDSAHDIERTNAMLRFSVDSCRISLFRGGRALLVGTRDARRARALYDRYVGL